MRRQAPIAARCPPWHCGGNRNMEIEMAEPVTLELFSDYV